MNGVDFLRQSILSMKGVSFRTFSELAAKAGVSQGNLSSFLKGDKKKTVSLDTAWKLFEAIGVTFSTMAEKNEMESHVKTSLSEELKKASTMIEQLKTEKTELQARLDQMERMNAQMIESLAKSTSMSASNTERFLEKNSIAERLGSSNQSHSIDD